MARHAAASTDPLYSFDPLRHGGPRRGPEEPSSARLATRRASIAGGLAKLPHRQRTAVFYRDGTLEVSGRGSYHVPRHMALSIPDGPAIGYLFAGRHTVRAHSAAPEFPRPGHPSGSTVEVVPPCFVELHRSELLGRRDAGVRRLNRRADDDIPIPFEFGIFSEIPPN